MKKLLTASIIACSVLMGVGIANTNAENDKWQLY